MIECPCGRISYSPKEVMAKLKISALALTKFRKDGYIDGKWHSVGHIYSGDQVQALQDELYRRNKNVKEVSIQNDTRTN